LQCQTYLFNNVPLLVILMNNHAISNNVFLADGFPPGSFELQTPVNNFNIAMRGRAVESPMQFTQTKKTKRHESCWKVKLSERAEDKKGGEVVNRSSLAVSSVYWDYDDPEQVGVWCRVARVMNVFAEEQEIEVKMWLSLVWKDEEICKKYKPVRYEDISNNMRPESVDVPNKEIWNIKSLPNVLFANIVGAFDVLDESCQLSVKDVGPHTICWTRLLQAKFCHPVHAYNFPFDYEDFQIHLRLLQSTNRYFALFRPRTWMESHRKQTSLEIAKHAYSYICPDNSHIQEWTICSFMNKDDLWYAKFDNDKLIRMLSKVNGHRGRKSSFFAYIAVKRSWRYYAVNIWSIFVLSTYFSLLSFSMDPGDMHAERLNFTAAILFLQLGVRFTVIADLPKLSYLTTMDIQIYFCMVIVMSQAFLQSLIHAFAPFWGMSLHRADTVLFYMTLGLTTVLQAWLWAFAKWRQRKDRQRLERRAEMFAQSPKEEKRPFVLRSTMLDLDEIISGKIRSK